MIAASSGWSRPGHRRGQQSCPARAPRRSRRHQPWKGGPAILWKEANEQTNNAAAKSLRLAAKDNLELGIVDEIIPEPIGGTTRNHAHDGDECAAVDPRPAVQLKQVPIDQLLEQRYQRYRKLGVYLEQSEPASV